MSIYLQSCGAQLDRCCLYFPSNPKLAMVIATCHITSHTSQEVWPNLPQSVRKSVLPSAQHSSPSSLGHYIMLPQLPVTLACKHPFFHFFIHTTLLRDRAVLPPLFYKWARSSDRFLCIRWEMHSNKLKPHAT